MESKIDGEKNKIRILLVDDDQVVLAMLAHALQHHGYEVEQAESGMQAMRMVSESVPDLAILDVQMPDMSGIELAQYLHEETNIPFLFHTAFGDTESVMKGSELGAVGYLIKPLNVAQIIPTIESGLARAREIMELRKSKGNLTAALDSARDISLAVGIIMIRHRCNRDDAFNELRLQARTARRKVRELAKDLIREEEVRQTSKTGSPVQSGAN